MTRSRAPFVLQLVCGLAWAACDAPKDDARERAQQAQASAQPPSATVAAPVQAPPPSDPAAAQPEPDEAHFAGSEHTEAFLLAQLLNTAPRSIQPVGRTATVLRLRLEGPVDAAFKAPSPERPRGPSAEIAAYRLARCLGLHNVPPVISRALPAQRVEALLVPKAKERWPELRERFGVAEGGLVRGAAIYWVPELVDVGIDKEGGLQRIGVWLSAGGELPEAQRSLAASASTMLAFDYLIGNFDRWSGDNVAGNAAASFVYMRDNDLAFGARLPEDVDARLFSYVKRSERFSRSLHAALTRLTRASFEEELARDPGAASEALLTERQLQGVFERRAKILAHIDAQIAASSEASVLMFP